LEEFPLPFDLAILRFFDQTLECPFFDFFFKTICDFSIWRWPVIAIILLLFWKGGSKGRLVLLLAILTAAIIDPTIHYLLKPGFGRLRPCHEATLHWLRFPDGCGGRYGFPSSHAANFFGQAVIIGAFYKSSRYYIYPLAILVAIGRIYLGVHYPSDVLGGAIYGAAIALMVLYFAKRFASRKAT
jgi:undecaprenyl-diphosphatase